MILPGNAPMYVLLCPRISASSLTPPNEILTNSLPIDLAIDFPRDVLPTPGGPAKHKIGPRIALSGSFFIFKALTAKYSIILSLTFSKP